MKILILADPSSPHTIKWVNSLNEIGFEIFLFGLNNFNENNYDKNIKVCSINIAKNLRNKKDASLSKILYLSSLKKIKQIIKDFNPDLLHSHYASSYGLLGALTGFHPLVISVWGADVFNFPHKFFFAKKTLSYNLSKADKILATSKILAQETEKFIMKPVMITPFGVDIEKFQPKKTEHPFNGNELVIGTVKHLEKKYGIDFLIKLFKKFKEKYHNYPIKLLIVGGGTEEEELKDLAEKLHVENDTIFTGFIDHNKIPEYHNMMDISLFLSVEKSESFGVSVIEASACEKPVIVSNIGGLPEVVENNVTGFVVEPEHIEETLIALEKLVFNISLRKQFGKSGRERVKKIYNWNDNLNLMADIYKNTIENYIKCH